jgi:hypothetical protein
LSIDGLLQRLEVEVHVLEGVGNLVTHDHVEHLFFDVVADQQGLALGIIDAQYALFVEVE